MLVFIFSKTLYRGTSNPVPVMESERLNRRTKRYLASVLVSEVGVLVAIALAFTTSKITFETSVLFALASIVGIGIAQFVLTYQPTVRYRDRQLSTFFTDYLRMVEDDIETTAPGDVTVRANVMRPTTDGLLDGPTFSISFTRSDEQYHDEELDLEFEAGQGCVGNVYEENEQKVALSPTHAEAWGGGWNTTERQDKVTGHLNTVIGTPVYRPSDAEQRNPVAVLIIDSESRFDNLVNLSHDETLADIGFKETTVAQQSVEHARNIGILL